MHKPMDLEGKKVVVNKSAKQVYEFFIDLKNFKQLMPDNIQKFQFEGDSFLFALEGMPEIRLVLSETIEFSKISLAAASSKLSFTLTLAISTITENSSAIQLHFNGDFNPMLTMMLKKPLKKFIEILTENLVKV